jgi:hypothetical protein
LEKKQASIFSPKLRALEHIGFAGVEDARTGKQHPSNEKSPVPTKKRNHPPHTSKWKLAGNKEFSSDANPPWMRRVMLHSSPALRAT